MIPKLPFHKKSGGTLCAVIAPSLFQFLVEEGFIAKHIYGKKSSQKQEGVSTERKSSRKRRCNGTQKPQESNMKKTKKVKPVEYIPKVYRGFFTVSAKRRKKLVDLKKTDGERV